MALRDASELRDVARRYRVMAGEGEDPVLKAGLLRLADEFDQEAASQEAASNDSDDQ